MAIRTVLKKRVKPVTHKRPGVESTVNGFRVPAAAVISTIEAYVQPMSPKELRNVPEGQNTVAWYSIWALSEVRNKDVITWEGSDYTVQRATGRPEGGFWRASAVHVNDAP